MRLAIYIIYLIILTIVGNLLYYKFTQKKNKGYFIYSLLNFVFYAIVGYLWLG